mgnify:FL=1
MKKFLNLTARNVKVFFSDESMFFTSLITPMILLILYVTFLGRVFHNSLDKDALGVALPEGVINAVVNGQILACLLAVCSVTVAFSSNLLMVNDKVTGSTKDIDVSPIKSHTKSLAYFTATFISTIIINLVALILCLLYIRIQNCWYYEFKDVLLLFGDVMLLSFFGTALASVVNFGLKTQGQLSAVANIVSAGYGFICGAYMPISNFSALLRDSIMFLPSTYFMSLIKNHALTAPFREMAKAEIPSQAIDAVKTALDYKISFFSHEVSLNMMYLIAITSIFGLIIIFVLQNKLKKQD